MAVSLTTIASHQYILLVAKDSLSSKHITSFCGEGKLPGKAGNEREPKDRLHSLVGHFSVLSLFIFPFISGQELKIASQHQQ